MWIISISAFFGFLAVLAGACVDHAFKDGLSPLALNQLKTAIDYQFIHALALLAVGVLRRSASSASWLVLSAAAFSLGILLFCGGLFLHAAFQLPNIVYAVPLGGLSFMAGWLFLFIASIQNRHD